MHLGFHPGELSNIGSGASQIEDCLRIMLAEWMEWIPGDNRGSTQTASLRALKDAVRRAGCGRTAHYLSLTREQTNGNTRVRTSTERNGSEDEPATRRPRLE